MDIALNPGSSLSETQSVANTLNTSLSNDQNGNSDPVMDFGLPSKGLKIMHLNVHSLGNKVELIRILLSRSFDILALTETWLDETWNDEELAVVGYNLFHRECEANNQLRSCVGGRIVIHVHDALMGK